MKFWHRNEDDGAKFSVKYDTIRPELSGAGGPAAKYDGMREPHMFNFLIFIIGAALMFGMGVRSVLARRRFQPSGKENSNSSFPEDYTVKISDLQTVVSRLDKIVYKGKKYDKGSSLTDIYRKAIRLYGSYLMEIAKVVGSSQPADAQRQAMLDLDNYLFHSVKKMECTYVKENLLETRNNLLYPELAKLFKQLLSVKTISALRLQALQSDRKGYDDIDFFRDLYKGLFNGFDPQSAVSYEQMDIQLICLEAWLDIMQEATEHNSIKKRLTNELHSLHDRLEELSTTHSQREVRDMYILLLRRMDQYFRVVS